jgi:uncharacterized protein (TIGR03067 family)
MLKSQRRLLPVLISLALTSSALAAGSESKLAGTWRAQSAQRNGAPAPDLSGHSMILSGDTFRIVKDTVLLYGGTYKLSGTQQIDFHQTEGPTLRGDWKGLYRLRGSGLEIVDNADDTKKPRPNRFRTSPDSGYVLVRFQRQ